MRVARMNWLYLLALGVGLATGNAQALASASTETQQTAAAGVVQSPSCDPNLIEGTFTFASLPAGEQTVSLHLRNTASTACRLHGQMGASFAVDGHSMAIENCWPCDQSGKHVLLGDQFLIAPGETVTVDLHWASAGTSCQWADWVDFVVQWSKTSGYLFIPSGWPLHVCSSVKSSGYRVGADSLSIEAAKDGALRASMLEKTVYNDERATLHVELTEPAHLGGQPAGCADLYTVRQGPSMGMMRLDPLPTLGSPFIASFTQEQIQEDQERAWPSWKKDRLRRCNIEAGRVTADAELSAADLANVTHIVWRTATAPGKQPAFLTTATHFTVLDVDTLAPNWGDTAEGIHAGLSVDRSVFKAGEKVPLHIRWENVNAAKPLGQEECGEPWPALEIQDSQHNVLRTIPMQPRCMGHGWGPFAVQRGKDQRVFRELTTAPPPTPPGITPAQANLPGPGVYYLVSVWSPRVLEVVAGAAEPGIARGHIGDGHIGDVYATARSLPVRVEVVPNSNPYRKKTQ